MVEHTRTHSALVMTVGSIRLTGLIFRSIVSVLKTSTNRYTCISSTVTKSLSISSSAEAKKSLSPTEVLPRWTLRYFERKLLDFSLERKGKLSSLPHSDREGIRGVFSTSLEKFKVKTGFSARSLLREPTLMGIFLLLMGGDLFQDSLRRGT